MSKKKLVTKTPEELELDVYKNALNIVLKRNNLPAWEELDNLKRKEVAAEIKSDTDEYLKDESRYFSMGYTMDKNNKAQIMVVRNFEAPLEAVV